MGTPKGEALGLSEIFFGPFSNLFRRRRAQRTPGRRMLFEPLEHRLLLSADPLGAAESLATANHAPVLSIASYPLAIMQEDAGSFERPIVALIASLGSSISDPDDPSFSPGVADRGIAVTGVNNLGGMWQFSLDGGISWDAFGAADPASALLLDDSAGLRFVPNTNFNTDFTGPMTLQFRAWDLTSGASGDLANTAINGGTTAFSTGIGTAELTITAVNDAPVRTSAAPAPVVVNEDSANINAVSLGLGGLAYAPGPVDELGQTLTYAVTSIPSFIAVFLADGATQVTAGNVLFDISALRGLTYKTLADANGSANLVWTVTDSGPGTPPDANTLTESLSITVNAVVNDAPVRTSAAPAPVVVNEDSANINAVSLGLGGLAYAPGPVDELGQTLTYAVTSIPSFIAVFLADGATQVTAGNVLFDISALRGLTYKTLADANGSANLVWTVTDSGPGTPPDANTLTESLSITVNAVVNDAPVRTSAAPAPVVVNEDSANINAVSLGLGGLAYAPGPVDELGQTLTYAVTSIPSFIAVFLADGATQVTAGNVLFDISALRGLTYKTLADANGSANLVWTVTDSGPGTPPDANTLTESLSITVNAVDDAPAIVYIDDGFIGIAGTLIIDADPVAGGNQAAVIGVNAFATIQAGVDAVGRGGTVKVNAHGASAAPAGAYAESVSITKSLTLDGNAIGGLATGVVIDPTAGNGITVLGVDADNVTILDLRVTGGVDGISATGVGDVTITNVWADNNTGDGISLTTVGDVTFNGVVAIGNDPGVFVNGAASFSDSDGVYSNNDSNGIQLIDIAGVVSLARTTANDNDANNDGTGDGVNMTDGADLGTEAIGALSVSGGSFSNTAAAGGQRYGIRVGDGIGGVVHSVAGAVVFQSDGVVGPLQHVSVTGNQISGVEIEDGGTSASFTGNGDYSSNQNAGVSIASLSGGFTAADSTFSENVNHGIQLIDIGGLVSLTRVTANDNDANNGTIGDGVVMTDGADAGTEAIGSLQVTGGSFSDTAAAGGQRYGIRVGDGVGVGLVQSVGGEVSILEVTVTGNQSSGVEIEDGGTSASVSGNYSSNLGAGFTIASLSGSFTASDSAFSSNGSHGLSLIDVGDVHLSGISANDNTGDGIRIVGAGHVTTDTVTAIGNDPGVLVNGAASFSDTDGVYTGNDTHGIQLIDIAGVVSLARTTANDNDANNDGTGDGVNMTDGADLGTEAIGALSVSGGSFSNTAAAGGQRYGIRVGDGIGGVVHSVAGAVVFQSDGVVGPLQHVSVTGNQISGVEIEDGGTSASFTGNGDYSSNQNAGVSIASLSGGFTAADSTFSENVNHGIQLIDIGGLVSLTRVTANDNDANNGTIGDGVVMTDGADAGTEAIGSLQVTGGSFSDTAAAGGQRYGIRVGDGVGVGLVQSVGGEVSILEVTVTGNQSSGVEIEDGGTSASVSGNYSSNLGAGFTIASLSGSFTASDSAFSSNGSHGLSLIDVGDVHLSGISANDNTGDGIRIVGAGHVTTDTVTAIGNDPGVLVNGAASFSDTDGVYTGNDTHGIQLIDIAGVVSLARTTANDNDANNDGTGDGVNMTDGADLGTEAIGALSVSGGSFSNTAAAGGQRYGIRVGDGIGGVVHSVAGAVVFQSDGVVGPLQHVSVTGNQISGVEIEDGGTSASFTGNGDYSSNQNAGVSIASLSGGFTAADSTFSENVNHGIQLIDIGGLVSLTRVTANDNDANNGTIGDGVVMTDGADAGTEAIGSLQVTGGSFSDTAAAGGQRYGIRVGDGVGVGLVQSVGGEVSILEVTVTGNQSSGVEIEDGGTSASVSGNYSSNLGAGFTIASLSGSFTASDSAFSSNGSHGLSLIDVGDVHLSGISANDNTGDGIRIVGAGHVTTDTVTAIGNDPGVLVNGAASFSDTDGVYTGNDTHGIQLIDIAGVVSLARTTANDNDANNDGTGDGVNMTDGADLGTEAIGALSVSGGSFSNTAAAGGQRYGIRVGDGIGGVVHSVAGAVVFQSDGVVGPLQHVSVTGNQISGVEIEDGGTSASFTGNGDYSSNQNAGVSIASLSGGFTAADSTFSENVNHGIQLIDIGGLVSLTRVTANDNDANNGTIGDGVVMTDGADAGTEAIGSLQVTGGSFSDTAAAGGQRYGIRVGDGVGVGLVQSVGGEVSILEVTVTGNQSSGVEIEDGGTSATFTNGTYSNNGGDGIRVASLATTLTVSGVTASNNAGDGLDISDGGTAASLSGVFSNNASGRGVSLASDTISVNGSLASGTGAIVLTAPGGVFFTADAVLQVDLAGTAAGQFTAVSISGAVTLDGRLDADLVGGFTPTADDRFEFMTFGSRTGFFGTLDLPPEFVVEVNPTSLELVFDPNDPPVFVDIGPQTVEEGRELRFTVNATDVDVPAQTLTFTATGLPAGATFDPSTREFVWVPADEGSASVTFTVTDSKGAFDVMTVALTATNAAPIVDAGADQVVGLQDIDDDCDDHGKHMDKPEAEVSIAAVFDDLGLSDTHTATINWGDGTSSPGKVLELTATADGSVKGKHTYTRAGDYTVTVTVRDNDGGVTSDTLTVKVRKPIEKKNFDSKGDEYKLTEDTALTVNAAHGVLDNDRGPAGATLKARVVEGPEHGKLLFNADGSFTYVPDRNFHGKDSFWYEFTDGNNVSRAVEVKLNVKDDGNRRSTRCIDWDDDWNRSPWNDCFMPFGKRWR